MQIFLVIFCIFRKAVGEKEGKKGKEKLAQRDSKSAKEGTLILGAEEVKGLLKEEDGGYIFIET